jgi:hypothetical protein
LVWQLLQHTITATRLRVSALQIHLSDFFSFVFTHNISSSRKPFRDGRGSSGNLRSGKKTHRVLLPGIFIALVINKPFAKIPTVSVLYPLLDKSLSRKTAHFWIRIVHFQVCLTSEIDT